MYAENVELKKSDINVAATKLSQVQFSSVQFGSIIECGVVMSKTLYNFSHQSGFALKWEKVSLHYWYWSNSQTLAYMIVYIQICIFISMYVFVAFGQRYGFTCLVCWRLCG